MYNQTYPLFFFIIKSRSSLHKSLQKKKTVRCLRVFENTLMKRPNEYDKTKNISDLFFFYQFVRKKKKKKAHMKDK